MKIKTKNLDWLAGRPVVILTSELAKKLNVHLDERISLIFKGKKIYAVVDIFEKIVGNDEVGVSKEISGYLGLAENSEIDISAALLSKATKLIKKKLDGEKLSKEDFDLLISEIVKNNLTEAEIAYFVAAEMFYGLDMEEIINLTEAMVKNGNSLSFNGIVADKHCIGGLAGNRTTPIIVSICSAAGLKMPKTSSRAITSAAGTADVIETIANVELSAEEIKNIVEKVGACLAWGGSLGLAPSDDKIIQVERLLNIDAEAQLLASIMSKKIAVGSNYLLIDIPYGKNVKTKTRGDAKKLARKFHTLAEHFKINLQVALTEGEQPIGNGFGPVLEMLDVLAVLKNKEYSPQDLREKSLLLSSEILSLCGVKEARKTAEEILVSGKAFEKFMEIINAQNGKRDFESRIKKLKPAKFSKTIYSNKTGKITEIDNKKINNLCRILGTPASSSSGVYLHKHLGPVKENEALLTLYSESEQKLEDGKDFFKEEGIFEIK